MKNSPDNPSSRGAHRILQALKKRGFRLREKPLLVDTDEPNHRIEVDYLMNHHGDDFAVEVKAAGKLGDWLFNWLARPILVLQALQRLRGWKPLLAIYSDSIDIRIARRFKKQVALYAPNLWWLIVDGHGRVFAHLPSGDEDEIENVLDHDVVARSASLGPNAHAHFNSSLSAYGSAKLSFGDLDQWLSKVLLFSQAGQDAWGGPKGPIRNLARLAKLAAVSPPLVYRWAAAMERSGYLDRALRRPPVLHNLDGFLREWRGRYRVTDNEAIPCQPVFGEPVNEAFGKELLDRLRQMPENTEAFAITGHQATRLYRLKHSEAATVHLYVSGEPAAWLARLRLVPSERASAPIMLLQPRHPRSVFGGVQRLDAVRVCDLLQIYLDLYHLPDRGREQADFIYERRLEALLHDAQRRAHGIQFAG